VAQGKFSCSFLIGDCQTLVALGREPRRTRAMLPNARRADKRRNQASPLPPHRSPSPVSHSQPSPTLRTQSSANGLGLASPPNYDPFHAFMVPPPDESPADKATRLALEEWEATRNAEIEEMLRLERQQGEWPILDRPQQPNGSGQPSPSVGFGKLNPTNRKVRVLLVGQSESGKSTVLKSALLSFFLL
jgi:hypothetical protein